MEGGLPLAIDLPEHGRIYKLVMNNSSLSEKK